MAGSMEGSIEQRWPKGQPRGRAQTLAKFNKNLTPEQKQALSETCFRDLFNITCLGWCHNIFTYLMHMYQPPNTFRIGTQDIRFMHYDMSLILGLSCLEDLDMDEIPISEFRRQFFPDSFVNGNNLYVKISSIQEFFRNHDLSIDNFTKMSLIYVLSIFLLPNNSANLDFRYVDLVDDLPRFNRKPWGRIVYDMLINEFVLCTKEIQKEGNVNYNIKGCPYALLIWAYEHIPCWRPVELVDPEPLWPRVLKWPSNVFKGQAYYKKLLDGFSGLIIHLTPTDEELLVPFVEHEDVVALADDNASNQALIAAPNGEDNTIDGLKRIINGLQTTVSGMQSAIKVMQGNIDDHQRRIEELEKDDVARHSRSQHPSSSPHPDLDVADSARRFPSQHGAISMHSPPHPDLVLKDAGPSNASVQDLGSASPYANDNMYNQLKLEPRVRKKKMLFSSTIDEKQKNTRRSRGSGRGGKGWQ